MTDITETCCELELAWVSGLADTAISTDRMLRALSSASFTLTDTSVSMTSLAFQSF